MIALAPAMMLAGCDIPAESGPVNMAEQRSTPAIAPVAPSPVRSPAATPTAQVATTSPLPADVVAFKSRRDSCDHFRGEEAGDDARAAELGRKLAQTCGGTDAALAALRKRHAGDAAVIAALADYEDEVE